MASLKEDLSLDYDLIFLKDRRNSQSVKIFRAGLKKLKDSFSA